jgi:phosphoribosylanthranilate isomerase
MSEVRFKVCGITRAEDARAAVDAGASWLGFNLFKGSPRYLPVDAFRGMRAELPARVPRVAVLVEPDIAELRSAIDSEFDFFQVHFRLGEQGVSPRGFADQVGAERLWLAPKLPPGVNCPPALLTIAQTIMLDTYSPNQFGGTGRTGDWERFARHREAHPHITWILAGGLNAGNVAESVKRSGARIVDVSSGVESAPGIKDPAKIFAFASALKKI